MTWLAILIALWLGLELGRREASWTAHQQGYYRGYDDGYARGQSDSEQAAYCAGFHTGVGMESNRRWVQAHTPTKN